MPSPLGTRPQPSPSPAAPGRPVVELVAEDLEARARAGERTYGARLRALNGRDALLDAYHECLDLACYLRQALEERTLTESRKSPG